MIHIDLSMCFTPNEGEDIEAIHNRFLDGLLRGSKWAVNCWFDLISYGNIA